MKDETSDIVHFIRESLWLLDLTQGVDPPTKAGGGEIIYWKIIMPGLINLNFFFHASLYQVLLLENYSRENFET